MKDKRKKDTNEIAAQRENKKMNGDRPLIRRIEAGLIICLLSAAFFFMWWQRQATRLECVVSVAGTVVRVITLDVSQDEEWVVPGRPAVTLRVKADAIAFAASDCPDKICVHTGWLAHNGQSAACLPNGVLVLIRKTGPASPDEVDIMARMPGITDDRLLLLAVQGKRKCYLAGRVCKEMCEPVAERG